MLSQVWPWTFAAKQICFALCVPLPQFLYVQNCKTCEMQSEWTKSSSRWLFMQGLVNTIYDMKIIWNYPFFKERVAVPTKDKLLLRIYLLVFQNIQNWPKSKLNFYTSLSPIILWQWICWSDSKKNSKTIYKVSRLKTLALELFIDVCVTVTLAVIVLCTFLNNKLNIN